MFWPTFLSLYTFALSSSLFPSLFFFPSFSPSLLPLSPSPLSYPPFHQTITSLEEKIHQLQQEAESTKSRHSRDTARLRKKIEEEKQTASKITDSAVS